MGLPERAPSRFSMSLVTPSGPGLFLVLILLSAASTSAIEKGPYMPVCRPAQLQTFIAVRASSLICRYAALSVLTRETAA